MKIELESDDPHMNKANGLRIYGASECPVHGVWLILARPANTPVDLKCALEACDDMRLKLLAQATEKFPEFRSKLS